MKLSNTPDTASTEIFGEIKPAQNISASDDPVAEQVAPLKPHASAASSAKEVTIRQVAPLVLVLTGATFLNVSRNSNTSRS